MLNRTTTSKITISLSAAALAVAVFAAGGVLADGAPSRTQRPAAASRITATSRARDLVWSPSLAAGHAADVSLLSTRAVSATRRHHLGRRRLIAWRMMYNRFPWRPKYQFRYVNWLWERESSWNPFASNPYSGAYGIPQAVPGSKMASAGSNWRTSARTQIRWGLRYIRARYGSPRRAWRHSVTYGWY